MALFLEILDGEHQGTLAQVRDGLSIGRKRGSLTLRDSKLSSLHAAVQSRPDGSLWLVDQGSSNGIKVNGTRMAELELTQGLEFVLGRTTFKVVLRADLAADPTQEPPADPGERAVVREWWESIQELAERGIRLPPAKVREIAAFRPILKLRFIRGIQTGAEWTVGYGPRTVGTDSVDLTLEDVSLPGLCFSLIPQDKGVVLKNETDRSVKLNGRWVETEFLRSGDVIEIGSTQIQVVFDDNE
jgi:hypothetical protein